MAVLPDSLADRIKFVESHIDVWTLNAAQLNLSLPEITALDAAADAARAALVAQSEAQDAARAATQNLHNLGRAMSLLASDAIKAIKLHASQTNDPNVYVLANIPAPVPPKPAPPPQPPTDLIADPNADGTVTLKWKGSVAHQTFFAVYRKLGDNPWVSIGSTSLKAFIDAGIPSPAPSQVLYQVRAQRQNIQSAPSATAGVAYGAGGVGVAMNIAGSIGGSLAEAA